MAYPLRYSQEMNAMLERFRLERIGQLERCQKVYPVSEIRTY
jgi:hypothetical protein